MKLLVVDSHPIVAEGCRRLFLNDPDVEVVAAEFVARAKKRLEEDKPDVVLTDIDLPDGSGIDLARELANANPPINVLLFSEVDTPLLIAHALTSGAKGYIVKSSEPETLKSAILAVSRGESWLAPELAQDVAVAKLMSGPSILAPREEAILHSAAKGLSLAEIAAALDLSYRTTTEEAASLRSRFRVSTLPELVRVAAKFKLI